jgi:two-component system chemotaxis response regulator CheY
MSDFTILLVDDSTLMRRLVREMLGALGYSRIIEAADGGEALAVLERHPVDAVIADWNMPMGGLHLLQAMRNHTRLNSIPLAMMTRELTPHIITQAVAAGVTTCLTKPFGRDQLATSLRRLTQGRVQAA